MSELIAGGADGVWRIEKDSALPEEGPRDIAYMTQAADGTFAVSRTAVLWRRNKNGAWDLINERAVPNEVWSIGADPRLPGRLWLGVSPALIYRSDDDGASWRPCESLKRVPGYDTWTFPPPPHIPHVRSIAPDPRNLGAVFIGVEEGGIYSSADGGESWESLNEGLYWDVHTVAPPAEGANLYATTGAGFHRSDDEGRHWRHITQGIERRYTVPLLASRKNPGRLFTAAAMGPPPTWRDGLNGALYRSDDAGEGWHILSNGLPARFDVMVSGLVEDDSGRVFAAAGGQIFVSEDAGESWNVAAEGLPRLSALALA
jgi:photosystem II stability/assembly factor-like uncharacterized protein